MFKSDGIFSRFMNCLFDILYVGILWIVCSLPVLTVGAATTAAYYAMAKCVRHKTGYIGREFFKSFRSNLKQSLLLTVFFYLAAGVWVVDIVYVWQHESSLNNALFVVLLFLGFFVSGVTVYCCPLLSRFQKKNLELLKTAAYLLFKFLPVTVGILVLFAISCTGLYLMPWAIFVLPGVYLYVLSFPMEWILHKLMPAVPEDSEEAQKWYYQHR